MKIILTGGAGFIASHVADAYIKAGHTVVIVDNLSSGSRRNLNAKARFYKADIRNLPALLRIFKKEKPDAVNHHAAFISVTDSVKKPAETFNINATGTLNVLLAMIEAQRRPSAGRRALLRSKFIFSSTGGAIYGDPKKLPATEATPASPLSPYALTKLVDEELVKYFCPVNGISYTILRYANVFGPRQKAQAGAGIFPIFMGEMRRDRAPYIFGNGGKTRDYVYVGDVARANVLALARGDNQIINIATNHQVSDRAVFDALANALQFNQNPIFRPKRKGEVEHMAMSYAKAEKMLKWKPMVSFENGVQKTVHAPENKKLPL
ncbi:MAG: NAD-dependent epimerase/dehydratase family protein [Patescibacteria group bacterium]|nr:NAD-dependent epimerase/dehydratase family protein [Patescibacteria group bacterium]